MKKGVLQEAVLLLLAILFSTALIFAFIEIPALLDNYLQGSLGFPQFDHGGGEMNALKTEIFIKGLHLRLIGYFSLILILVLIIIGYASKRSGWALAGAIGLFLPVFGQFAFSMFFLAGLGFLRVGWLPFLDISFDILDLGKAIYIPYWILMWFFGLFKWNAHDFISWFFMASGAFLFTWGVLVWFRSRYQGMKIATSRIYRVSRHPQYLGWILWSYGFILFSPFEKTMKMSWSVPSSLPWLLMTMTIVGMCMMEEVRMLERAGKDYKSYRLRSPFLFPLPSILRRIVKAPAKLVTGKEYPETGREVVRITLLYTVLIILLSLFWFDFSAGKTRPTEANEPVIELKELTREIREMGDNRKSIWISINKIPAFGIQGRDSLLSLARCPNPIVREFSIQVLANDSVRADEDIYISNLTDPVWRVRAAAIHAVSVIRSRKAVDTLIRVLEDPELNRNRSFIYGALGSIGDPRAIQWLSEGLETGPHYEQSAALNAIMEIDAEPGLSYARSELQDTLVEVRRNAVMQCILRGNAATIEVLETVLDDEDFEVRFYAKQGIKRLGKN